MSKYISLGIALLVILGVIYWAYNSTAKRSYDGANLSFAVGSGSVTVTNTSDSAIPVTMRTDGRAASFRVMSSDFDLSTSSTRRGNGRTAYHAVDFAVPVGESTISVTRGSDVQFVSSSSARLSAVVTPQTSEEATTTIMVAMGVIFATLFFMSHTTEHQWISVVRTKLPIASLQPKRT